jgi:hypothetical protein
VPDTQALVAGPPNERAARNRSCGRPVIGIKAAQAWLA